MKKGEIQTMEDPGCGKLALGVFLGLLIVGTGVGVMLVAGLGLIA